MAAAATTATATAAATVNGNALSTSSASSLPMPRSPPKLPDLYGKHRLQAQLQSLNREITFLEVRYSEHGFPLPSSSFVGRVLSFLFFSSSSLLVEKDCPPFFVFFLPMK